MRKFISKSLFVLIAAAPSVALAAPSVGGESAQGGIAGVLAAGTALVVASTALVRAIRGDRRAANAGVAAAAAVAQASEATTRAEATARWADRLANAQQDGVVLVLSYPQTAASCRGLLEANGWRVAFYPVTSSEVARGDLLPGGDQLLADVASADAVVVEGLDEAGVARLAETRALRDRVRSGASVVLYTGSRNFRYDLTAWSECDQAVNMPVTAEAAVRASLARREVIARRQGVRPGQLAAARNSLRREGAEVVS